MLLPLLLSSPLLAATWPAESEWQALTQGGTPMADIEGDHQRSGEPIEDNSLDVVGDFTDAAVYWYADGEDVLFRMRITETPCPTADCATLVGGSWSIAINTDPNLETLDYAIQFSDRGINLLDNTSGDTGPAAQLARVTNTADVDWALSEGDLNFGTKADWFVDIAVSRADLARWFGIADDTELRFTAITDDSYNALEHDRDMAGSDDSAALGGMLDGWSDPLWIDGDGDGLTDPEEALLGTDPEDADSDDDGLSDAEELAEGTDALSCDSDGDGLPDGLELGRTEPAAGTDEGSGCFIADTDPSSTTDPLRADTDAGGVSDGDEDWDRDGAVGAWEIDPERGADDVDTDGDGIWDILEQLCPLDGGAIDDADSDGDGLDDSEEWLEDLDGDGWANFCDEDSDGDGLEDVYEGEEDSDGDGIPNYEDTDSDGDGTPDEEELLYDDDCDGVGNAYDADDSDGPCGDSDGDGVSNEDELDCGSDPERADSDGDGIGDGEEDCVEDEDCDGVPDRLDGDSSDGPCSVPPGGGSDGGGVQDTGTFPTPTFGGGNFTGGGGCSSGGLSAALLPSLIALLGLLRRRRELLLALPAALALAPGSARAQEAAQSLNAQRFTPAIDGRRFLSLDDSQVGTDALRVGGGLLFNYANDPFVYRYLDESLGEYPILETVGTADGLVFVNLPLPLPVRLGADLPLHLLSSGYRVDGFRLVGDTRLRADVQLLDRGERGLGLGASLLATLPTGNEEAWLGEAGPTFGGGLTGSVAAGRALLLARAGFQSGSGQILDDVIWGNRLRWGLGSSFELDEELFLSAELSGEYVLASAGAPGAAPVEALAGLSLQPWRDLVAHLGAGAGLSTGIGSPDWRALAGITWNPRSPVSAGPDRDGDGVPDAVDLCPDQPEDRNGVNDDDGCPDGGLTPTRLRFLDQQGRQIAPVTLEITAGPETGSWILGEGELMRSLPPGSYRLAVSAEGFAAENPVMEVPEDSGYEQVVRLQAVGELKLRVIDADGAPIAGARVVLMGDGAEPIDGQPDGTVSLSLPEGEYRALVSAEGFRSRREIITISGREKRNLELVLTPSKAKVEGGQIRFDGKIYFETNKSEIKQESFNLLDDIANIMESQPELKVRIEGHTDSVGREAANLKLSQARADAVKAYLVEAGIDADRMTAVGKGETERLIKPDDTEEKRARNRRVEFDIID